MLLPLLLITGVILLTGAAFILGRHFQRRQQMAQELSPVSRQHIDLFQGGQLSETAVNSAKERFRALLEQGQLDAVESSLRAGTHYVINVRALAEIGTDDAGRILERQLSRRLTEDQLEQCWYWIDLANGLRSLNREQSLPHLLRCAETAGEVPLGHFFAAETVCFLTFPGYLREPETAMGKAALRILHRALEGLRFGLQPQVVPEARLGEAVEKLWDNRPDKVQPLVVRVFAESVRQLRRAQHAEKLMSEDRAELEAYHWQMSRLSAMEPVLTDYLAEAPTALRAALLSSISEKDVKTEQHERGTRAGHLQAQERAAEQRDILQALSDLRAETAAEVLPMLADGRCKHLELGVETLSWSKDSAVGPELRAWAARKVPMDNRALKRLQANPPRRSSVPADVPYRAIIRALRNHPSAETEGFLILAAHDWDPTFRAASVSCMGWWEPIDHAQVSNHLQKARKDPNVDVRQAARAALARLGERTALQWYRQALSSENPQTVHEAIQSVAAETLTLLWPDLDRLTECEEPEIAHHAAESVERLAEEMEWGRKGL